MNVPLSVKATVSYGKEKLILWANQEKITVPAPINPYFYTLEEIDFPVEKPQIKHGKNSELFAKQRSKTVKKANPPCSHTAVEGVAISDFKKKTFYKYEFYTRSSLVANRVDGKTFEDNIIFTLRNRIDNPDFYLQYPHTNDLVLNFLDIEQVCSPGYLFPIYADNIVSISWAGNDREISTVLLDKGVQSDKKILELYGRKYSKPDVEILYNKKYDIPTIIERCKRNGIPTNWMSKGLKDPYIGRSKIPYLEGIIVYDILDSTQADQSLSGNVSDRKLKTVTKHFGFEGKDLDPSKISEYIGTPELIDYNQDDVRSLFHLFDIYMPGILHLADDLKIPLNLALDLSVFDLSTILLGDLYREHNIICDGSNRVRYPEIFQRKKKKDEPNYQGPLVGIEKYGRFVPTLKGDFSSMYPTIATVFNLSPDTCRLVEYQKYVENGFKILEEDDKFIYYIPDDVIDKTVVISVLKQQGFLSQAINKLLKERASDKAEYKRTGDKAAQARSWVAKLKANGLCGILGSATHPFGYVPIAIAITGIGRQCIQLAIDTLESLYPNSVCEFDTDGCYFTAKNFDEDAFQTRFKQALKDKFKRSLDLEVEIDHYEKGWFYLAKNYILKKGDNVIIHGAALKGSHKAPIERDLTKELANVVLEGSPVAPIGKKYTDELDALSFPLKELAMQMTMGKPLKAYKSENCTIMQLARQAKEHFNIEPEEGNSYYYIKTKSGFKLLQLAERDNNISQDVDIPYYVKKIEGIVEIFNTKGPGGVHDAKLC